MSSGTPASPEDAGVVAEGPPIAAPVRTRPVDVAPLAAVLRRIADGEDPGLERLSRVGETVSIRVDGADPGATLLLDRTPMDVLPCAEAAGVEIHLTAEQARAFARGALSLPAAVAYGELPVRGDVRRLLAADAVLRRLLREAHGTDEPVLRHPSAGPPAPHSLAIETRDLERSFGSQQILRGVDLAIPEGVISVILGPSGTGKSVLLNHLIGLTKPDAGHVLIRGRALDEMTRREVLDLRREIGVMFQDGALFSMLSVYDNVAFPLRQHTDLDEDEIAEQVHARLDEVGLLAAADRMPSELSGGMRKRAGLARSLILEPAITLCDEPDSGLDPVRTALLGELLRDQHERHGGTIVVVTHNVPLARLLSDHISVLWQGRILEAGMSAELLADPSPFLEQFLAGATEGPVTMDA